MKKLDLQTVLSRFAAIHGSKYDYSRVQTYVGNKDKLEIICPSHGAFMQSPLLHMKGSGCPVCSGNRLPSVESFFDRCNEVHKHKYDYSKAVYTKAHSKILIGCPEHGEFWQKAYYHVQGSGCPTCGGVRKHTTNTFVECATSVHGDTYDYSETEFKHNKEKVRIVCRVHGPFWQTPNMHLGGQGCTKCGKLRNGAALSFSKEQYIEKANTVHSNKYDYSLLTDVASRTVLDIVCPKHGVFNQVAYYHLAGNGCQKCANVLSKGEDDVCTFLENLGLVVNRRNRSILGSHELDAYVPEAKLAVEFCGNYYHSDIVRDLGKNRHYDKYKKCSDLGIHLVTLYENEWSEKPDIIKDVLKMLAGKHDSRQYARKLALREVPIKDARQFFANRHIQGAPRKGVFYGLFSDGVLVACMGFAKGASLRGDSTTWELLRYASEGQVVGGASRLFKAFVKAHNPEEVVSFSDNRWFTGGMYKTLGFVLGSENKPDYVVWSNKTKKVYHKTLFQRSSIPARINEFGSKETYDPATDPRTEREMTKLLNCGRIYDCGKKRWVWKRPLDPNPNK